MRRNHARAAAVSACGSGTSPAGGGAPPPAASGTATSTPSRAFNAADVAFAAGMLRLDGQARAMAALVAGHTAMTQLRHYAARLLGHDADARYMRDPMTLWHPRPPAPYAPGAAPPSCMGPGMMDSHDWADMGRQHGHDFNDHWLDAMTANHIAEIALCRAELTAGASPQARNLARTMLRLRQAELTQLRHWRHSQEHHAGHN
ncbi:MAG TPA: DUF305 domain-containing protein [Streptosporangiaceae bacterium]|nr:DUF305 domain-containing protein [Streptosporangiaceae bacterium]